ncbi:MAG TPA: hypothetical protein VKB51_02070 [bacterium]|nr:hypothetical protein [bacterium]
MTTETMSTHTIGVNTFAIFSKEERGGVWTLQFIWGKKDFRIYLGRSVDGENAKVQGPVLESEEHGRLVVTRLQYLNAFEWYDYQKVSGHGLANEEVCWRAGKSVRYVELPKDFFEIAVELACREFGLKRVDSQQKAS